MPATSVTDRLAARLRAACALRHHVALLVLSALAACGGDATAPIAAPSSASGARDAAPQQETIVVTWSSATLQAIRTTKPGPPISARALAIVHTAMYDAWAAYDQRAVGTRLGGTLRRPPNERTEENKRRAISYAAYRALVDLFPSQTPAFDALMMRFGYDAADRSTDLATATGIGNVAAQAVLDFRHRDGSNQLGDLRDALGNLHAAPYSDYTGYAPVNTADNVVDPTRWQPLRVNGVVQQFVAPHWQRVTPFAMTSGSQFRFQIIRPNFLAPGQVQAELEQIIGYSRTLDDRTKAIAEYWADGPHSELPPGHWCLFGAWVSQRDRHTIDDDAKMFFAMENAVMDAGIAAWDAKRFFDTVRPVTAVRYFKAGKTIRAWGGPGRGTVEMRGEDWAPYQPASVVTPPFPEFISGHSAFSAASAEVLRRFTGSDAFGASVTIGAGSSRVEPGLVPAADLTLSWPTFSAAADEAGMSRRYGGIHFAQGDVQARLVGRLVGAQAWAKAQQYFEGTAR
jgi:predicted small lipoprotein YifL